MNETVEPELIDIFTLHEIPKSFKEKFVKCLTKSIEPLQLDNIMKRFLHMRHWEDVLLRAVLTGQNTAGRNKQGDQLREIPRVIELRVRKLDKEMR